MTENLLQTLEEKLICLLEELDCLQDEVKQLQHENHMLKAEKTTSQEKLQSIVTLLDTFDLPEMTNASDARAFSPSSESYLEAVTA